ncbi:MAG: metallopeptidase TldD-related protein [Actinomycetota bacterium]
MSATDLSTYVDELVSTATADLQGDEVLLASFSGEDSDFVRFNKSAVRQAGSVRERRLGLDLIEGKRHTTADVPLAGDPELDTALIAETLASLREQRRLVPEDPYLLFATEGPSIEKIEQADLPDPDAAVSEIVDAGQGHDLVGIYASGTTHRGFASSLGQRHWFSAGSFDLDWSFYLRDDKAAKNLYADTSWNADAFERKVAWSRQQLAALDREPIDLERGGYRTYLAPMAILEIMDMLSWGGFSMKAQQTKQTPLLRMITESATFHPSVRITEDIAGGTAPPFQEQGFARPDEVVLIEGGKLAEPLISPRSAQEYEVATNGAAGHEAPESVHLAAGDLPSDEVLERLDTGLYVGNLWYLNFSDRAACRTTGMTRFATFWVEGGEIVAPVNVLRFDDTAFHLLGDRLVGLTDEAELLPDVLTYAGRSTNSSRLPGALVEEMTYTL